MILWRRRHWPSVLPKGTTKFNHFFLESRQLVKGPQKNILAYKRPANSPFAWREKGVRILKCALLLIETQIKNFWRFWRTRTLNNVLVEAKVCICTKWVVFVERRKRAKAWRAQLQRTKCIRTIFGKFYIFHCISEHKGVNWKHSGWRGEHCTYPGFVFVLCEKRKNRRK